LNVSLKENKGQRGVGQKRGVLSVGRGEREMRRGKRILISGAQW
jgi:hypothetical protein